MVRKEDRTVVRSRVVVVVVVDTVYLSALVRRGKMTAQQREPRSGPGSNSRRRADEVVSSLVSPVVGFWGTLYDGKDVLERSSSRCRRLVGRPAVVSDV